MSQSRCNSIPVIKYSVYSENMFEDENVRENMDYVTPYIIKNMTGHTIQIERKQDNLQNLINLTKSHADDNQNRYILKNNRSINIQLEEEEQIYSNMNENNWLTNSQQYQYYTSKKIIQIKLQKNLETIQDINLDKLGQQLVRVRNIHDNSVYSILIQKVVNNMLRELVISSQLKVINELGVDMEIKFNDGDGIGLGNKQDYQVPYDIIDTSLLQFKVNSCWF